MPESPGVIQPYYIQLITDEPRKTLTQFEWVASSDRAPNFCDTPPRRFPHGEGRFLTLWAARVRYPNAIVTMAAYRAEEDRHHG